MPMIGSRKSRAARGAALALGVLTGGTMLATPAMAAKDPKPAKPVPLKLTPNFQKAAGPLQQAIEAAKARPDVVAAQKAVQTAGNNPTAVASAVSALGATVTAEKAQLDQLFALVGGDDDKFVVGQFAVQLGSLAQDQGLQRRGINAMIESGKSAPAEVPKLQFFAGQLAYVQKDYKAARAALEAAIQGGYKENDPEVMLAEAYMADNQLPQGLTLLQKAIADKQAAGTPAPESWYRRGLSAAYSAKAGAAAGTFGSGLVKNYGTPKNWGLVITVVREIGGIPGQEMVDLLRLMGRTNSYSEGRDYLEYIEAADPRKLPGEVVKILDAGVAAGKLNASDRTVADYRAVVNERIGPDKASLPSLERDARGASATALTVLASGDAFLSYGDAAKAEALYAIALTKPGVDQARALTRLGIAQTDQGKYTEAQATFAKVSGNRKPIADLWAAYAASKAKPAA
jgi:tetratricopeptide (TPR) repeat protein